MHCDWVWGGFKVVWCVLGCFHGPRQYNTVFSVTNKQSYSGFHNLPLIDMVFDWFTISYPQMQVIPMKTRPQWSIKPHVLILINYICDLPLVGRSQICVNFNFAIYWG